MIDEAVAILAQRDEARQSPGPEEAPPRRAAAVSPRPAVHARGPRRADHQAEPRGAFSDGALVQARADGPGEK